MDKRWTRTITRIFATILHGFPQYFLESYWLLYLTVLIHRCEPLTHFVDQLAASTCCVTCTTREWYSRLESNQCYITYLVIALLRYKLSPKTNISNGSIERNLVGEEGLEPSTSRLQSEPSTLLTLHPEK